ncbi:MAG: RagB/SusD family nutrient uptake outer membrane protein, partial [Saprospiraceae bacterium]|nr:RagB/SusD family nutrient uptake outer membrane protein [Saprospiraceae bacterium]
MKYKIHLISLCCFLLIAALGFMVSCNDLNLEPLDKSTSVSFYKSSADFDAAIFAAYSSMQDMWVVNGETGRGGGDGWGSFWAVSLAPTDDVQMNNKASANGAGILADAVNLDKYTWNTTNKMIYTLYSQVYEGITRANLVIENVNNGTNNLTDAEKKQFIAEAKFIRGFFHFIAAQTWGTPPLVTETPKSIDGLVYSNSKKADLYAAVIQDFKDAYDGLPESWNDANIGRATKYAAKAFEGKAYVWQENWNEAVAAFEEVESKSGYELLSDYEDVFAWSNENSKESVFEIQYGGPFSDDNGWVYDDNHSENFKASQGIARTWFMYTNDAFGGPNSLAWYVPTSNLLELYKTEP